MAKHEKRQRGASARGAKPTHTNRVERREPAGAPLTEEQERQVEALLAGIPPLADALRAAAPEGRDAVASHLAEIEAASEPAQLAFATRLGDARGPSAQVAVEVAHALGELATNRDVAREARRSRIRLRSAGALPTLDLAAASRISTAAEVAPVVESLAPQLVESHVSQTREEGEVSLILAWQEGNDPDIVRGCALLLDFWRDGVRDFSLSAPMTRRRFMSETSAAIREEHEASLLPITWSQARHLLQEALGVNAWRGTEPDPEYRRHQSLLQTRVLDVPDTDDARAAVADEEARYGREGDRPYMASDLEPDELVANWLGQWCFGDYGAAYDLLADDNPIRRELARDEYVARRRQWADEAKPAGMRLTLVREQEQRASALWVPGAAGAIAPGGRHDIEAFWSITLAESPLGGLIAELPLATLSSQETGRHWYWTAYTVERDRATGVWRVARIRDEGATIQALNIEELQKRVEEARATAEKIVQSPPPEPTSDVAEQTLRDLTGALTSALHYQDALISRLPLDESLYRASVTDAQVLRGHERAAAVLERMLGRFPGQADTSFELGLQYYLVATQVARTGDIAAEHIWLDRAARALTQAAETDPTAEHLQGLGEILARQGYFTQAVARLREAIARDPSRASAHSDLADALMAEVGGDNLDGLASAAQGSPDEQSPRVAAAAHAALAELREAARLDRNLPGLHSRMGAIFDVLGQPEDALLAFQEAVRHDPDDPEARYTLGTLYLSRGQTAEALSELEAAARLSPMAPAIRINLAACYIAMERWRDAERELDFVDEIRPGMPQVAELRSRLARHRKK